MSAALSVCIADTSAIIERLAAASVGGAAVERGIELKSPISAAGAHVATAIYNVLKPVVSDPILVETGRSNPSTEVGYTAS